MSIEFTSAQKKAIKATGSVLVSAAAGSGKTAVLTERVIRKLTDTDNPVPADKLLIVTFTNAAALEMRTRIENRLYDECAKYPNNTFLLKQKHLLNSADICTIDSFCINLVRENFDKCFVEQDFRVTTGTDMSAYTNDILTEIIDEKLKSKDENFIKLLELVGYEKDDSNLRNAVDNLYRYSVNLPFSDTFFENLYKPYYEKFESGHIWYEKTFSVAEKIIENIGNTVRFMESLLTNFGAQSEKAENEIKFLYNYYLELKKSLDSHNWNEIREASFDFSYKAPSLSSQLPNVSTYKSGRESIKKQIKKLQTYFTYSVDEINFVNNNYKDAVKLLSDIVKEYSERVFNLYCDNNCLAFYHTEQLALGLLCKKDENGNIILTDTAKEYLGRYDEVLVDEYQDVNDLQELLFSVLSNNQKNLFVVGDIKQSIYAFRGSKVKNFAVKKNTYIDYDKAEDKDSKKIILSENFRSRKSICDFVNFVFSNLMTEKTGDIIYNEEEVLNFSADYDSELDTPCELIVVKNESDGEEDYEIEANAIADYIFELVNKDSTNTFDYSDICVLFEGLKKASVLSKILSSKGIPVSFVKEEYHKTTEVSLVLSLLAVIDNPLLDVELLTVMMSPLFGFSADDVALIRNGTKKGELYRAVLKSAQNGNQKCLSMLNKLRELRNKMVISSLGSFLVHLIYDTDIFAHISSLDNAKHRRKNLEALINLAQNFYDGAPKEFIKYIKTISNDGYSVSGNAENAVSIMTMHKSKGLQFPVVILSDLSKNINKQDARSVCIFTENTGIGFKYFDEDEFRYKETVSKQIISSEILEEEVKERLRLLYVAMTRAEEKLVMVATTNKNCSLKSISENIIDGEISPEFIKNANSLAHFVLSACLLHPDADNLRDLVENKLYAKETESKLNIRFYDNSSLSDAEIILSDMKIEADKNLSEKIKENLSYEYPFEELSDILAKTSVTAVVHGADDTEYFFNDKPSFLNKDNILPTQKGTAMHKVMQFIDFGENVDVKSEIDSLVEWQFITEEEGNAVDIPKISAFFNSGLYKRIQNASFVKREMRFLTEINAKDVFDVSNKVAKEKIIVQGAVDLLFIEDNGLVIVDFKTDRAKTEQQLTDAYSKQLDLYAVACQKIFGKTVKDKIIYSFELSKEIKL